MYILLLVVEILIHISGVLLPFPVEDLVRPAGGQVAAQHLPHPGPVALRDPGPAQPLQLRHVHRHLGQDLLELGAARPLLLRVRGRSGFGRRLPAEVEAGSEAPGRRLKTNQSIIQFNKEYVGTNINSIRFFRSGSRS